MVLFVTITKERWSIQTVETRDTRGRRVGTDDFLRGGWSGRGKCILLLLLVIDVLPIDQRRDPRWHDGTLLFIVLLRDTANLARRRSGGRRTGRTLWLVAAGENCLG